MSEKKNPSFSQQQLELVPPAMPSSLRTVELQIVFNKIGTIDIMNEVYQADVQYEAEWVEDDSVTVYDPEKMWNPKLFIQNCTVVNKEDVKHIVLKQSGKTIIQEKKLIKGVFWEKLELNNFPFDVQELSVEVASRLDKSSIDLIQSPTKISHIDFYAGDAFVEQQKWNLYKFVNVTNEKEDMETELTKDKTAHLFASITVSRKPGYYIFNAFMLIFLINSMSMAVFSVDCKVTSSRLQITLTLLLTSVIFKWNTNRSLPPVSYLTAMDYYSIISIIFLCLYSVWHAIVGSFWDKPTAVEIDKWVFIGFVCCYGAFNLFYVGWIMWYFRQMKKFKVQEDEFLKQFDLEV